MKRIGSFLLFISCLSPLFNFGQFSNELFVRKGDGLHIFYGNVDSSGVRKNTFTLKDKNKGYTVLTNKNVERKTVELLVRKKGKIDPKTWRCWEGKKEISLVWLTDSTLQIPLQFETKKHYYSFYEKGKLLDKWLTQTWTTQTKKVIIVPLVKITSSQELIQYRLNEIYQQAGIEVNVELFPMFKNKIFSSKNQFSTPDSLEMYTGQMRLLRDQFFLEHPTTPQNAYYLFVIPSFSDSSKMGFMLKNKAIGFVPYQQNEQKWTIQLGRTLAMGMGMLDPAWESISLEEERKDNLLDSTGGTALNYDQVDALRSALDYFSRIDNYEQVRTNNGTIAYYFWQEQNGWITLKGNDLLGAIQRPFRKNFLSSRFQVKYALLKPFYRWNGYYISIINFGSFLICLSLFLLIRRKLKKWWMQKNWKRSFFRKIVVWSLFFGLVWSVYRTLPLGNELLDQFTVISGELPEMDGLTIHQAKRNLFENKDFRKKRGDQLAAEILIEHDAHWEIKKRLPVLYFRVYLDENNQPQKMRFLHNSDSLKVDKWSFSEKVTNHYVVFNFVDKNKKRVSQKVYSYDGKELTNPSEKKDIPKRILVFVNGYRPTSVGHSLEENFNDILKKGLENKNSSNHIYPFDRYDYWQPWNQINLRFQERINPTETYYADGHFSVRTSNFRSILNFTRIAQSYPKRCSNKKKHVCRYMNNTDFRKYVVQKSKTENVLKMRANKSGFSYRKKHGKIAGLNLLQILNELPDYSKNDTLFIVAHSMGFAYSEGMIDVLRGKIQFGGMYILAPENAKSGKVNPNEWQEVWQYGSRFHLENADAPCLQDGVAPQSGVKGLGVENRIFIPENWYNKKGFFDSHFVGYYTWVLDLQQGNKGAVKQR